MRFKRQSGQAVLIVLLSLSVVLVVIMYALSRSITDVSLSTKDENAMRAFSAAEAGVERALIGGPTGDTPLGEGSFNASISDYGKGSTKVVYPFNLKSGELATFWFVEHGENGNLNCDEQNCFTGNQVKVCWGELGTPQNSSTTPAAEFTLYYTTEPLNLTKIKIARAAIDVFSNRDNANPNNFNPANFVETCEIDGEKFQFSNTFSFNDLGVTTNNTISQGTLLYASVKLLYNGTKGHKVGLDVINSNTTLPSQGKLVDSTGKYSDANRKISVYRPYPVIPPIFENAIYSGTGISQ